MTTLEADIADETFADLKNLVYKTVHAFIGRRPVPPQAREELISDGLYYYAKAVKSFDPAKGVKLGTWVATKVRYGLLTNQKRTREFARTRPEAVTDTLDRTPVRDPAPFDPNDLLYELREDAGLVVRLVLDSPGELWEAAGGRVSPHAARTRLAAVLEGMGWQAGKIRGVFKEIAGVLAS